MEFRRCGGTGKVNVRRCGRVGEVPRPTVAEGFTELTSIVAGETMISPSTVADGGTIPHPIRDLPDCRHRGEFEDPPDRRRCGEFEDPSDRRRRRKISKIRLSMEWSGH